MSPRKKKIAWWAGGILGLLVAVINTVARLKEIWGWLQSVVTYGFPWNIIYAVGIAMLVATIYYGRRLFKYIPPVNGPQSLLSQIDALLALVTYPTVIMVGMVLSDEESNWLPLACIAVTLHVLISFKRVVIGEIGVRLQLERNKGKVGPGLYYVFALLNRIETVTENVIQTEVGSHLTDTLGKAIVDDKINNTFLDRAPFRVTFPSIDALLLAKGTIGNIPDALRIGLPEVQKYGKSKNDPLHQAITCEPRLILSYRIEDAGKFISTLGDIETLSRNIANVAKGTIQELTGVMTAGMMNAHKDIVCAIIRYRIEQLIGEPNSQQGLTNPNPNLGVNLISVSIKDPGFPKDVNKEMAHAVEAGYKKAAIVTASEGTRQSTINISEGDKKKKINEGAGNASAKQADMLAEAAGIKAKIAALGDSPMGELIVKTEAAVEASQGKGGVILPMDLSIIGSLTKAVQTIVTTPTSAPPPPTNPTATPKPHP